MSADSTAQKLASITNPGLFEGLASAVLLHDEPLCKHLVPCGVNTVGQTIPSPLDGICFVSGADPPHMVAVQHTITRTGRLRTKWLHDSATVRHRKSTRHETLDGDLIKTVAKVREERQRRPNLRATLVLSTNQIPSEDLVRDVHAAGAENGIEVVIWSQSKFCSFLDNDPTGQWIRRKHLGIQEELLSIELLRALSKRSLELYEQRLQDLPSLWVDRALDGRLNGRANSRLTFVVGEAGSGKSVACYRRLRAHVEDGGVGMVLQHQDVATEVHLEAAVMGSLCRLHSTLAQIGPTPFSLCSSDKPLLLVVEDINHAPQPQLLVEKLAGWTQGKAESGESSLPPWRILCPSWPQAFVGLQDRAHREIEETKLLTSVFVPIEGQEAVLKREQAAGCIISPLRATEIAETLGNDPLLIGLHRSGEAQDTHQVIKEFVEGALRRAAAETSMATPGDLREALRALSGEMLQRRQLDLQWHEIRTWRSLQNGTMQAIAALARHGELLRLSGSSADQRLIFRHDRVRDWLFGDAAADLESRGALSDELLQDQYFADIFGIVLAFGQPTTSFVDRVASVNPLALFCSLRMLGSSESPAYEPILAAVIAWLDGPASKDLFSNIRLRAEALRLLSETDSKDVPTLVRKLGLFGFYADFAYLRNGVLDAGISLCADVEPWGWFPMRDMSIEHAKLRDGDGLIDRVVALLRNQKISGRIRSGALRLAGHLADSRLVPAVEICWNTAVDRVEHLEDYLWAFARCCGPDAGRYLAPVCDAWDSLSEEARSTIGGFDLSWAFQQKPPSHAVEYLILRAKSDQALRSPIMHMLHGTDLPCAVEFVARELAEIERRLAGPGQFSPFLASASSEWFRAQEQGRPMSPASRSTLCRLWHDGSNDRLLRGQAFGLWAVTTASGDLGVLRDVSISDDLADRCLWERLRRCDEEAVPALLDKLKVDENWNWWRVAHYVWSSELTAALDESLTRRAAYAPAIWGHVLDPDLLISELVMRLPETEAARLLQKHWSHLGFSGPFVQAALFVASPPLLEMVRVAAPEFPNPRDLFRHITRCYGHRMHGRSGLVREAQVEALEPYLDFLEPMALRDLWEACNKHRWFGTRRRLLDSRQNPSFLPAGREMEQISAALERFLSHDHLHSLDRFLDHYLDAGIAWANLLAWMTAWLEQKRSVKALNLVATAITLRGGRKDLDVLNICNNMPEVEAKHLVANTRFVVLRSRLS